jgi:hypothetical protein
MFESLSKVIQVGYLVVGIGLVVLAVNHKNLPGRTWLLIFLVTGVAGAANGPIVSLLFAVDFGGVWLFDYYIPFVNHVQFAGFCALIPYLLIVTRSLQTQPGEVGAAAGIISGQDAPVVRDSANPFYGVKGWLKFFVIVHMFVAPVIFAISQILAFAGFFMLFDRYPGLLVVGVIEAAVGGFLVVKWIMIARRLRDMAPGVIQEAKLWLKYSLAWVLINIPLVFFSGMDADDLAPGIIRSLVGGVISFAIWYSYFNMSKRVKATYSDWDK